LTVRRAKQIALASVRCKYRIEDDGEGWFIVVLYQYDMYHGVVHYPATSMTGRFRTRAEAEAMVERVRSVFKG